MKKRRLSAIAAAAVISAGMLNAFPASVYAKINLNDLPEPISSDKLAVGRFEKQKPQIVRGDEDHWYGDDDWYFYYYDFSFSWKPVKNALLYYVYEKKKGGEYELIGKTVSNFYYEYYQPSDGTTYKIRAVTYTYDDEIVMSDFSNELKYTEKKPSRYDPYEVIGGYEGIDSEGDTIEYEYEEVNAGEAYDVMEEPMVEYAPAPVAPSATAGAIANDEYYNTEEYSKAEESGFKNASSDPLSTFSADVDTASYANLRRLIKTGRSIPEDAVRIEEMLNYFDYDYPAPAANSKAPFSVYTELSDCPWNKDALLMMIGVQGREIPEKEKPASNLVFLVDTSGSMDYDNKLPLAVSSINSLAATMGEDDRLSIVTYSGEERIVLAGASGKQTKTIADLTEALYADGSTNGESGINAAYSIAERYFIEGGNNRIILATDGDLNVGISSEEELTKLIEKKRESGVYFTVLGFGEDNIKDNKMEALADHGNGSYHYIDSENEALKVLVEERDSTLFTIAKDVKFQVEFNPAQVGKYRLIGYDNRRLNNEDFNDDTKDAGEIGAGHRVTALYEIIPAGKASGGDLKYSQASAAAASGEWANVKIRWKNPGEEKSMLLTKAVPKGAYSKNMSTRMKFACAVTEFGLILKNSDYKGDSSMEKVMSLLSGTVGKDAYKAEFKELVRNAAVKYMEPTAVTESLPEIRKVTVTHAEKDKKAVEKLKTVEINKLKSQLDGYVLYRVNFVKGKSPAEINSESWSYDINDGKARVDIYRSGEAYYITYKDGVWYEILNF